MITCTFCNKTFTNKKTFAIHLSRTEFRNFSSDLDKELFLSNTLYGKDLVQKTIDLYIAEMICANDIATSDVNIVKLITLMGIKRTSKQEMLTPRYKAKYLNAIQEKYGDNITNVSQVEEVKQKVRETCAEQHGTYDLYLENNRKMMLEGYNDYVGTDKHINAIVKCQDTCETRYGSRNFGQGVDAKKKYKKSITETIAKWDYEERLERTASARAAVTSRGGYSSKPEKKIRHSLVELDINFEANKFLWKYSFDMVFDKFIIEVQGDMWHANPLKYKEDDLIMGKLLARELWAKDARKKKKAEDNGYTVVYIWECEISKKTDVELKELVKFKLLENGYVFY